MIQPDPNLEIGLLLRLAHRRAAARFEASLQPLGIQGRHFGVLLALRSSGPLSQRELIEQLGSDKSSMVRTLDELEARGLCQRQPAANDRRANAVQLTDAGRRLLSEAEPAAASTTAQLLAGWTPHQRSQLRELLTRLIANAEG